MKGHRWSDGYYMHVSVNVCTFRLARKLVGCFHGTVQYMCTNFSGMCITVATADIYSLLSLLQIAGVVLACFVAIYKGPQENKYEVV